MGDGKNTRLLLNEALRIRLGVLPSSIPDQKRAPRLLLPIEDEWDLLQATIFRSV